MGNIDFQCLGILYETVETELTNTVKMITVKRVDGESVHFISENNEFTFAHLLDRVEFLELTQRPLRGLVTNVFFEAILDFRTDNDRMVDAFTEWMDSVELANINTASICDVLDRLRAIPGFSEEPEVSA